MLTRCIHHPRQLRSESSLGGSSVGRNNRHGRRVPIAG
ncbi:hypothetical protein SynROS8604_00181 [Synechococcus sp. ROS8604]|nr:hypothetical protein SynROS8604_00181 [Synechococcus sp. ROS8604]